MIFYAYCIYTSLQKGTRMKCKKTYKLQPKLYKLCFYEAGIPQWFHQMWNLREQQRVKKPKINNPQKGKKEKTSTPTPTSFQNPSVPKQWCPGILTSTSMFCFTHCFINRHPSRNLTNADGDRYLHARRTGCIYVLLEPQLSSSAQLRVGGLWQGTTRQWRVRTAKKKDGLVSLVIIPK